MGNNTIEEHKYQFVICAVLFGCDDSFIGLDMGEGLTVERKSITTKDSLKKIFAVDDMGLMRDYNSALIDTETLDVACIYKSYYFTTDINSAFDHFEQITSELYTHTDNQVRAIRLLLEGPIRYRKLAFSLYSEPYMFEDSLVKTNRSYIPEISEAHGGQAISKAHCNNIETLRIEMNKITFPIKNEYLQQCHILYDRSYLVTLPEAEVLLITALEVLFLKSEVGKKDKLSKRCATFLYEAREDRVKCYQALCNEYKNRSDYVHEGNAKKVTAEGIFFLRNCVRNSLLQLISAPKEKSILIQFLRSEIEKNDYWS